MGWSHALFLATSLCYPHTPSPSPLLCRIPTPFSSSLAFANILTTHLTTSLASFTSALRKPSSILPQLFATCYTPFSSLLPRSAFVLTFLSSRRSIGSVISCVSPSHFCFIILNARWKKCGCVLIILVYPSNQIEHNEAEVV